MSVNKDRNPFIDTSSIGGISFNVRSSNLDVLLVTLGFGTIICLILLYLVYLLVRRVRSKREGGGGKHIKSRADRPSWILLLVVSGSIWIFSTLLYSGVLTIEAELDLACSMTKFMGQYLFGYILWTCAVIYKLIRKFVQVRMVKRKSPHALIAIIVPMIPFLILAMAEVLKGRSFRDELDICGLDYEWLISLYSMILFLLFFLFIFLFTKIRKAIGAHHELIRYSIFLSTSFSFPLLDAWIQLSRLRYTVGWQQVLVMLVLLLVIGNLTHIFVLVLKKNKSSHSFNKNTTTTGILPTNEETMRAAPGITSVTSLGSESETNSADREETSGTLDEINAIFTDAPPPKTSLDAESTRLPAFILFNRPRRGASDEMLPDFQRYVDNLPLDKAEAVDRARGYFLPKNRQKFRTVIEFDSEKAFKYLDSSTSPSPST